ncbi:DNA translocase FtsK 4TM domain-containing protein [Candidatus Parcubacteria bacterium]|nr:DNA translocase FtsK 4TM domain-containing protein [Candidatus Parcubacteria bacterium]
MSKKNTRNTKKKNTAASVPDKDNTLNIQGIFSNIRQTITPNNSYVKNTALSLVFFVLFLFFALSSISFGGSFGNMTYNGFTYLLGYGYYVLPLLFIIQSYFYAIHKESTSFAKTKIIFSILLILSILGILELTITDAGGVLGGLISIPILSLFDKVLSYIFLVAVAFISLIILFEYSFNNKTKKLEIEEHDENDGFVKINKDKEMNIIGANIDQEPIKDIRKDPVKDIKKPIESKDEREMSNINDSLIASTTMTLLGKEYTPPPLSLLERDKGKPEVGDIKANANIIKRTLQNFGVQVEMDEISVGPSITRYALKPAEGVKLSKILGLQNNLSLALAAHPIRIEAPIPGKSLVGIEVPNSTKTMVGLGTLLAQPEYQNSPDPLLIALGKGVSGKMYYENLAKMPHALIAGTTGSGKSVMIHNVVTSLLYKNSPENLRFIFIDPKRVELTLYNKIPHLLTPVITDPKKAILALKWAGKEMSRRYDILEKHSVQNIDSYHKNILAPAVEELKKNKVDDRSTLPDAMPYIVIIIDELADIMQAYPRELESGIVRLAQMSRAVGIHLILSTQRPSVNVITGLIKANVPTRIALQVASQIDSRTILDSRGAEELLGSGDMLFLTGRMSSAQRVQSPNITEAETKKIVKYLVDNLDYIPETIQLGPTENQESSGTNAIFSSAFGGDDDMDDDDDLYEDAKAAVIEAKKASTSYLQRKLRVGYSRAARLMDILEKRGIIGPSDGAKPREILVGNPNPDEQSPETDANNTSENQKNADN